MGINLVANAWGRKHLRPGDEILLNEMEHHANLVPWQWIAQQTGARSEVHPADRRRSTCLRRARTTCLTDKTHIVAVTGMSNVLGTVPPLTEIIPSGQSGRGPRAGGRCPERASHADARRATTASTSSRSPVTNCTGRPAVGILYGRRDLLEQMDPFLCGGHMIEQVETTSFTLAHLPARFEAGTIPIAQAIALGPGGRVRR